MGTTKSLATGFLFAGFLVAGLLLAACGGDSEEQTAIQPEAGTAAVPPATAEGAPGTAALTDAAGATAAPASTADGVVTECPDVAEIAPIYGSDLTFDEANATSGAIGLLFCTYTEAVAPGTTNNFGMEPIPEEFSLTFTNQNIAVDDGSGGEEVPGIGEAALWNEFTGLSVWTGQQGLIVSIVFPPPGGDAKTIAIAIAQHVLA